jgi:hypothetical protein
MYETRLQAAKKVLAEAGFIHFNELRVSPALWREMIGDDILGVTDPLVWELTAVIEDKRLQSSDFVFVPGAQF